MSTLSNLTATGWIAIDGAFSMFPCDVCKGEAWFVRMQAPDCTVTALAGIGGARSDVYGVYCGFHA